MTAKIKNNKLKLVFYLLVAISLILLIRILIPTVFDNFPFITKATKAKNNTTNEFSIKIDVSTASLNSVIPLQTSFDKLKFKGGLKLSSDNELFGGISGMVIKKDGSKILSVTDRGYWFEADLKYDDSKNLVNIENTKMQVMRTSWGYLNKSKTRGDAEAICPLGYGWSGNTPLYVSFERRHRIVYFKAARDLKKSKGNPVYYPPKKILKKRNNGFEAIVKYPNSSKLKGGLLAIADKETAQDYINAYIVNQGNKKLKIKASGENKITDAALTKNLDLLILERKFSLNDGVGFQIRSIKIDDIAKAIKDKKAVDGEVLISATFPLNIDNFEAMAVHENEENNTIITIISDDNFNDLQSTLIYQFEYVKEAEE